MPVILARTAGFCFGVRRAVKMALNLAQKENTPLVTLGPLVHNQQAIDLLKAREIGTVDSLSQLKKEMRILIRAHGITPEVRLGLKELCVQVCDATCPHVTSTQKIVENHAESGYHCIIVGDRGHAEVDGLLGCAKGHGYVVETQKDLNTLPNLKKVCVVAQTTQDINHYRKISGLIKNKFPDAKIFETICSATYKRQKELIEIAKKSDLVIVVGGRNSANTKRLVEISQNMGVKTIHVETADELSLEEIKPYKVIGVTAGASTPHWVIRNVVETLADSQLQKQFLFSRVAAKILRFLIYSSMLLSLGAAVLTYSAAQLMGLSEYSLSMCLSFLFVFSMHLINKRMSLPRDEHLLYGSQKRFARYKNAFSVLAGGCIALSLVSAQYLGRGTLALVSLSVILGFLYSLTILPKSLAKSLRNRRLMDIPGSKDIFMSLAWGMVVVFIPYLVSERQNRLGFFFTFTLVAVLVFTRSILLDIRDLEGDIALGKETIPILLGPRRSEHLIRLMLFLLFLILVLGTMIKALPLHGLLLLFLIPYLLLHYPLRNRQALYQSLLYDGYLEGMFWLSGIIIFVWKTFSSV